MKAKIAEVEKRAIKLLSKNLTKKEAARTMETGKIRIPSDRLWRSYEESKNSDEIDVDEPILKEFKLAQE